MVSGKKFNPAKIVSLVQQGTALGPVLLIIFNNDLEKRLEISHISFCADDTRVTKHIIQQSDCVEPQRWPERYISMVTWI